MRDLECKQGGVVGVSGPKKIPNFLTRSTMMQTDPSWAEQFPHIPAPEKSGKKGFLRFQGVFCRLSLMPRWKRSFGIAHLSQPCSPSPECSKAELGHTTDKLPPNHPKADIPKGDYPKFLSQSHISYTSASVPDLPLHQISVLLYHGVAIS